jgi:hypothetical protein
MKTFEELKNAIQERAPLVWNDPDPIEGNDYGITYMEPIQDDFDLDTPIFIQYGEGAEAEIYLQEISKL